VTVAVLGWRLTLIIDDDDDDDDDSAVDEAALLATTDTAGITCLVALAAVTTTLPAPRVRVVRITDDWTRDLAGPDVMRGLTTGTRDVPPRLITTGPEVDVRITASPGLPSATLPSVATLTHHHNRQMTHTISNLPN